MAAEVGRCIGPTVEARITSRVDSGVATRVDPRVATGVDPGVVPRIGPGVATGVDPGVAHRARRILVDRAVTIVVRSIAALGRAGVDQRIGVVAVRSSALRRAEAVAVGVRAHGAVRVTEPADLAAAPAFGTRRASSGDATACIGR